jgi:hypothetical protein
MAIVFLLLTILSIPQIIIFSSGNNVGTSLWKINSYRDLVDSSTLGNIKTQIRPPTSCSITSFKTNTQKFTRFTLKCSKGSKLDNLIDFGQIPTSQVVKCPSKVETFKFFPEKCSLKK